MHYNFDQDIIEGEAAEMEVMPRVRKFLPVGFEYVPGPFQKTHDLRFVHLLGEELLIEVKWDQFSQKSKNVAVEFECSGHWSGIATTQAQVWVFKYFDGLNNRWCYRAVGTQQLVEEWRSKRWRTTYGGDNNRARMFLVPVAVFETWGVAL